MICGGGANNATKRSSIGFLSGRKEGGKEETLKIGRRKNNRGEYYID